MKVTIHQPEHFPYMGFFQKVEACDLFVVLDNVKFRKNYFQNRNRLKLKSGEDAWFTVPVENSATSKEIKNVSVSSEFAWRKKLIKMIKENLKFDATDFYEHQMLIDINMASIRWSLDKLGIDRPIVMASSLGVEGNKSSLLVDILRKVKADTYISGPSGREYLDLSLFEGIQVEFFEPKVKNHYSCLYNILTEGS